MKISIKQVFRLVFFLIFYFFTKWDIQNHDNIDSHSLAWWFTLFPSLYYWSSVIILGLIFLRLNFFLLVCILPVVFVNSFELYNRFYFVLLLGLVFISLRSKVKFFFSSYLFLLQPLNVVLLFLSNRKLLVGTIILLFFFFVFQLNIDEFLLYLFSLTEKGNSVQAVLLGSDLEHEIGNFSVEPAFNSILFSILFPFFFFKYSIGSLFFQTLIIYILFFYRYLFIVSLFAASLYMFATPNLASFYRNFVPLIILYDFTRLKSKKR